MIECFVREKVNIMKVFKYYSVLKYLILSVIG